MIVTKTKEQLLQKLDSKLESGEISLEVAEAFIASGTALTPEQAARRQHCAEISAAQDRAIFGRTE